MDPRRFDRIVRSLPGTGTRRDIIRLLAALPLGMALTAPPDGASDATARNDDDHGSSHRRQRRRARHRHQSGDDTGHRPGKRQGTDQKRQKNQKGSKKGKDQDPGQGPGQQSHADPPPERGCGQCPPGAYCDGAACRTCDVCARGCVHTSVQTAIEAAGLDDTIRICPGAYAGDLIITQSLTLVGAGDGETEADNTILHGTGSNTVLQIFFGANVTLQDLRVTGGKGVFGGGIYSAAGTLNVTRSTVTDNSSSLFGGGIFNERGSTLILTDSDVTINTAVEYGGGIFDNGGPVTLTNSTLSDNTAGTGGGGIYTAESDVTLNNSEVTRNRAWNTQGAGIFNNGGKVTLGDGSSVSRNDPTNCAGGGEYVDPDGVCAAP